MQPKRLWTPDQLQKIKDLMMVGKSYSEIAVEVQGCSRSTIASAIHRNQDFFKDVPRNGNGSRSMGKGKSFYQAKPGEQRAKEEKARKARKALTEADIEDLSTLDEFTMMTGRTEEIMDPWKAIQKNDKIFVYLGMALEPTFIFTRPYAGGLWRGHGIKADTKGRIFAWCNRQRSKHDKVQSAFA